MNKIASYNELSTKDIKIVRQNIDEIAFKRSHTKVIFWCIFDIAFYLISLYGVFAIDNIFGKIACGIVTGIAVSSLFVLAHDAAHGSLVKNKWLAEIIGTVFMLPSLNVYRLWCYGHNRVHHGFTSFSPIDWIWRPLTISEYRELSTFRRLVYRMERSFYGCGLHYVIKVWWPKMMNFMPTGLPKEQVKALRLSKLVVISFAVIFAIVAYKLGGFTGVFLGLILPFIVFNYVISLVVYLHHTHPDIPFFDEKNEWNQAIGVIYCTTVVKAHWLIDMVTHHILTHTPHHIDIRIPFYRLKTAFNGIKKDHAQYLHEYKLTWKTLRSVFKQCKLYDYHNHKWYSFSAAN